MTQPNRATHDKTQSPQDWNTLGLAESAKLPASEVLTRLAASEAGLGSTEASQRLRVAGLNAIRSHGANWLRVLSRQFTSPILLLLLTAAAISFLVGQGTDAVIIFAIISLSVCLGFVNEYQAARAVESLHSRIRHRASVLREGRPAEIDVTDLVPGDVVRLEVGDVVPADLRLLETTDLACEESVLTGEPTLATKTPEQAAETGSPLDLPCCAFMGTVVRSGAGRGVVVATGGRSEFGRIAAKLGVTQEETAFQRGIRGYSVLLFQVTIALTTSILIINTALGRPLLDSALFALAIAVGLTPQLLPAIVTISLSAGSRRLAQRSVVVKRLVSIEDFGNIDVLFTDKTGTLTEGQIAFSAALDATGNPSRDVLVLGLLCNAAASAGDGQAVGGNPLDRALWLAPDADPGALEGFAKLGDVPFDYDRRLMSVLAADRHGVRRVITKGAPESVVERCIDVPVAAHSVLATQFEAGSRVVAVATRQDNALQSIGKADERDLTLAGFLVFVDPVKVDAGAAISRLSRLGVDVKIVTGDNDKVARKVCSDIGIEVRGVLTGVQIETLGETQLAAALASTSVFARVTPDQKSQIIRLQRKQGHDVGFLGDGVNDAIALHDADVGISVDSATDVAKDAADIVLLQKDLNILADGVMEGRRTFSNTIKYVLMGTSSNFGNMFSAAGASLVLPFLPMLPTQILLNNFLYDLSEMTIPTDNVDQELLEKPAAWDITFIRHFMLAFGPISSLYDFMTFAVMIWVFNAGEKLFHSGWFVESLATQTLVIFIIRTRRVPFFRSRPSLPLAITTIACVLVGIFIPFSPIAGNLGFVALPLDFFAILAFMVITYLLLVDVGKFFFFKLRHPRQPVAAPQSEHQRRAGRRANRWTVPHPRPFTRRTS